MQALSVHGGGGLHRSLRALSRASFVNPASLVGGTYYHGPPFTVDDRSPTSPYTHIILPEFLLRWYMSLSKVMQGFYHQQQLPRHEDLKRERRTDLVCSLVQLLDWAGVWVLEVAGANKTT